MSQSEEEDEEYPPWLKVVVDDDASYWDEVTVLEPAGVQFVLCWPGWSRPPHRQSVHKATCFVVVCAGDGGSDKEWVEVKVSSTPQKQLSSWHVQGHPAAASINSLLSI
jgi:hypothetical protein